MDALTVDYLRQLNNRFYGRCASSFSATRNAPWTGWRRCLDAVRECGVCAGGELSVLDVACGNMRFAEFLRSELPQCRIAYRAVDGCEGLVPNFESSAAFSVDFQRVDIVGGILAGDGLADAIDVPACGMVACFGFMHHVPSFELRERALRALVDKTALGGVACVSFWQFMGDAKFARKAEAWHAAAIDDLAARDRFDAAAIEPGDYFLGWQNEPGLWRYCHHFDENEIDALVASACTGGVAEQVARFSADGKSGAMNRYVVLRRS